MMKVGSDPGVVGFQWWRDTFARNDGGARRARAMLRRAAAPIDVLVVPESHGLNRRLRDHGHWATPGQLVALAMVLPHVQRDGKRPIAAVFGERVDGASRPRLSQRRFDSLVRAGSHDDLVTPMRRAIACIGDAGVSLERLAHDLYFWGPQVAGRWCYQYHGERDYGVDESPEHDTATGVSAAENTR